MIAETNPFTLALNTNIIMKLFTKHFDITNYGCILDLFTDTHIFYYEFDNNHKITRKIVL